MYLLSCCNMFISFVCSNKNKVAYDLSSPNNSVILINVLCIIDKLFSIIPVKANVNKLKIILKIYKI